jgi:hypothetical protein
MPREPAMKARDLGVLLLGLAGLYTLLLAFLGLAQLVTQLPRSSVVVGGRLQIQATFVNGLVSVLLHLLFGIVLFAGRHRLADRLLDGDGSPAAPARPAGAPAGAATGAAAGGDDAALGIAAAGISAVAVLLIARVVAAVSFGASLLLLRGQPGDVAAWTLGGILVDLLVATAGCWLIARRYRVARRLLARPGAGEAADELAWQLPAMRFVGLALVAWHLPQLASAAAVFVKWWLRPVGIDLRPQALADLPAPAAAVLLGLYFLLLFPAGLGAAWGRLRPPRDTRLG